MISKITDKIFIGNSSDAMYRKKELNAAGITAILNVAKDLTNKTTTHNEFVMEKVGLIDGAGNSQLTAVAAVAALLGLLADGNTVLIHCRMGVSRSPSVVASALAVMNNTNFMAAIEFVRSKRDFIHPNPMLVMLFNSITDKVKQLVV